MSKTIDIKSLLIGFLLATSVMLFLGNSEPLDKTELEIKKRAIRVKNGIKIDNLNDLTNSFEPLESTLESIIENQNGRGRYELLIDNNNKYLVFDTHNAYLYTRESLDLHFTPNYGGFNNDDNRD